MKSNKLFMVILLGGMLSSGVSFGMDVPRATKVEEPTTIEKLIRYADKHRNKALLIVLLTPIMYKIATTSSDYKEFGEAMWNWQWERNRWDNGGPSALQKLQMFLRQGGIDMGNTLGFYSGLALEHAKEVVVQSPLVIGLSAGAAIGFGRSSAAKGWLDTPAMKAHTIDKQIEILEDTYNNMGYFKYMTGGAIGLQDAIKFLKAEKLKDQAAIEQ